MQDHQIPGRAETKVIYIWMALSTPLLRQNRFTSNNCSDAVLATLVFSISTKAKKQQTARNRGVDTLERQGGNGEDDQEHLCCTASHQQIHLPQTAPTQRSQHYSM